MAVYILSGARTPSGSLMGSLSTVSAPRLGAAAIEAAINKAQIDKTEVEELFMGQVIQAGTGQAPARQSAIFAGLPESVPCTTLNKVCGSGLKSVICAAQTIKSGDASLVVAGGMENMSLTPHLLMSGRTGVKFGATEMKDAMQWDALWDVYSQRGMGDCAQQVADELKITREEQDKYAIESFKRAQNAINTGVFKSEIAPITIKTKKGDQVVDTDEGPFAANFDKIPTLKPAFKKDGTITAANASSINDGAAALVIAGDKYKNRAEFEIIAYASHAQNPTYFTTAPIGAMKKVLDNAKMTIDQIDLFEINEAFAMVPLAAIKEFNLDHSNVNIYGSGISLGHPVGTSGARILIALMSALRNNNKKYGMASICIGGGEALAMIIKRI